MLRLLLQQSLQGLPSFFFLFHHDVKAGKVQVCLIKLRRHANANLELLLGLREPLLLDEKYTEIIQRIRIVGAQLHGLLQVLSGLWHLILAGVEHSQIVVSLGVLRLQLKGTP